MNDILKRLAFKYFPLTINEILLFIRYKYPFSKAIAHHLKSNYFYYYQKKNNFSLINTDNVLIIAPHPDDEVIGMGGTIIKLLNYSSDVTILYMTDGRNGGGHGILPDKLKIIRRKEAISLGKRYNLKQIFWNIPDVVKSQNFCIKKYLTNNNYSVLKMVKLLEMIHPKSIFITSFFDFSVDHFSANKILCDAMDLINLFSCNIICYEIWNYIPIPNCVVNITNEHKEKDEMLQFYSSQLKDGKLINLMNDRNKTRHQLYLNGNIYGFSETFLKFSKQSYIDLFRKFLDVLIKTGKTNPKLHPYITYK
jgi:LmbE family N-acetylglucosaminyl deacetylase